MDRAIRLLEYLLDERERRWNAAADAPQPTGDTGKMDRLIEMAGDRGELSGIRMALARLRSARRDGDPLVFIDQHGEPQHLDMGP